MRKHHDPTAPTASPADPDRADLPQALRWREWMARVEAVLFATAGPVGREALARVVGRDCALELLIDDIANALAERPYEVVRVAAGWQIRTRARYAAAIRAARAIPDSGERPLTRSEALLLTAIAYLQPATRSQISRLLGREVSRDSVARLHRSGLIARGPRSPEPGAPYTYVTTPAFLAHFGLESLRDLPDLEALEDAGLLRRDSLSSDMPLAQEAPEDASHGADTPTEP